MVQDPAPANVDARGGGSRGAASTVRGRVGHGSSPGLAAELAVSKLPAAHSTRRDGLASGPEGPPIGRERTRSVLTNRSVGAFAPFGYSPCVLWAAIRPPRSTVRGPVSESFNRR